MRALHVIAVLLLSCAAVQPASAQPAQTDSAAEDSYREARRALNRQQFGEAANAFRELRIEHPDSPRVAESYYWEAFALERDGALDAAVAALDTLLREHAAAGVADDARALRLRICGELAQRGNNLCAADVSSSVSDPSALDESMRRAAVNALINMRPERAVPLATEVLVNKSQPLETRKQALFVLADKSRGAQTEQVRRTLLETARDTTNDRELRGQAVFWLSEVPGEETLNALAELLRTPDSDLAGAAVFALAQRNEAAAADLLRELAANETADAELRKQAIVWIGESGDRALPFLMELYGTVTSPELREQILFGASQARSPAARDWLLARANDMSEPIDTRKRALFWAADAGLPIAELGALYERNTEREMRRHLIWLIAEHGGEGAADRLLEIARTDPDPELREQAVFWLADSNDPRASEYLRELLTP